MTLQRLRPTLPWSNAFTRCECTPPIWLAMNSDSDFAHTSIIVPSLSVNQEALARVIGAASYEEWLLFALVRLRNPNARVVYVTSQPLHPDIIEYYLDLLEGIPTRHARQRLHVLAVYDGLPRLLTQKVLERPRFIRQLRRLIADFEQAYLTCYNSTPFERQLVAAIRQSLLTTGCGRDFEVSGSWEADRLPASASSEVWQMRFATRSCPS